MDEREDSKNISPFPHQGGVQDGWATMHWQRFAVAGCSDVGVRPTVDERGADSLQATGLVAKMTRVRYLWRSVGHTRGPFVC
mgnify:FL=1|jgi:hypothetical protein